MVMIRYKIKGFTVIELLVVIAIIGILMAILLATFNDARMSARDDARQAQLKELQLALELYKAQTVAILLPGVVEVRAGLEIHPMAIVLSLFQD